MKIKKISIHNFKGFEELDVDFNSEMSVLGGKNGYGKTTIFDALEILFTGKIKRYADCEKNFDGRIRRNLYSNPNTVGFRPLVYEVSKPEVWIKAKLEIEGVEYTIGRFSDSSKFVTPLVFEGLFTDIQVLNESGVFVPISEGLSEKLSFFDSYIKFDYLSQEDSTRLLKRKETERFNEVESFFKTDGFDNCLEKIKVITKKIDDKISFLESSIDNLKNQATNLNIVDSEIVENVRFCDVDVNWDIDNPAVDNIRDVIDDLQYYLVNKANYLKIIDKDKRQERDNHIDDSIFYLHYENLMDDIKRYPKFQEIESEIENINSEDILHTSLSDLLGNVFSDIITEDIVAKLDNELSTYRSASKTASVLSRFYAIMTDLRSGVNRHLYGDNSFELSSINKCPLCGTPKANFEELKDSIIHYQSEFENQRNELGDSLSNQFSSLKQSYFDAIVVPIRKYFAQKGINQEIVTRYNNLDSNYMGYVEYFRHIFNHDISLEDNNNAFHSYVWNGYEDFEVLCDRSKMDLIKHKYIYYLKPDILTNENIEKKKKYYNQVIRQTDSRILSEIALINNKISVLKNKKTSLDNLDKSIDNKKNEYLNKVIKDIEILFYIYSGRIMQESYFGRGIFLHKTEKTKHVKISSNKKSDVDVLYNMSSGQLVSTAMALTLAFHKLYSKSNLLAIDDPIQTMDDINLWGFIETLRHDFADNFILLSTHEDNYGQLLSYKFKKLGLNAEFIDVAKFHKRNTTETDRDDTIGEENNNQE